MPEHHQRVALGEPHRLHVGGDRHDAAGCERDGVALHEGSSPGRRMSRHSAMPMHPPSVM